MITTLDERWEHAANSSLQSAECGSCKLCSTLCAMQQRQVGTWSPHATLRCELRCRGSPTTMLGFNHLFSTQSNCHTLSCRPGRALSGKLLMIGPEGCNMLS